MKKKIILLAAALMIFATGVSASSLNGEYKGNPIVIVKSDGKTLETDEVPGQILDGHTMVPISLLRQIGASVTWDPNTYSVDVKLPLSADSKSDQDYIALSKYAESLRGVYSFEEQYALISVIAMGLVPNITTKENYKTLSDSLDKVNTDILDSWVNQISNMGWYKKDTDDLAKAVGYIIIAKDSLRNLDSKTGVEYINKSKSLFNPVAQKIDLLAKEAIKLK